MPTKFKFEDEFVAVLKRVQEKAGTKDEIDTIVDAVLYYQEVLRLQYLGYYISADKPGHRTVVLDIRSKETK